MNRDDVTVRRDDVDGGNDDEDDDDVNIEVVRAFFYVAEEIGYLNDASIDR